ncbi:molybdopterin molybdotransferase [Palleronia aestuarii]|uniref:Molybdopterin molybdenumtransferase n=1 Tax=Palleronia aestuarii TaxID=568105 RepID=A0A2W7NC47_9RHOB|nr:molybdopterin molybdotransferase MoeA [Palleronia aestuarii]PZX17738.1 molybdopterin molybdotransferase [Palleronia aestuarii]
MISTDEALARIFALLAPLDAERVPIRRAAGRVLARPISPLRDQPPFPASAMDGYAIAGDPEPGARFRVIGTSAAGRRHDGPVGPEEAVRIFTGAPVPEGATRVVIQEDVTRDGDTITIGGNVGTGTNVRPAGLDFTRTDSFAPARRLRPEDVALLAAMGHAEIPVIRRPVVALIATGDELVMPGEVPGPDQIVASNNLGLAALVDAAGGTARLLPIARDTEASLATAIDLAQGADLVVTIGGASVGAHDIVGAVAEGRGMERAFYKVAMRPGKPLMAGRLDGMPMIGLPGNPVSSMVCGHVFLLPALRVMLGLGEHAAPRRKVPLAEGIGANGDREHYMRAELGPDGARIATSQDSALLSVLSAADALVVRPPNDPPREAGELVEIVPLGLSG